MASKQDGCMMVCLGKIRLKVPNKWKYFICALLLVFITCALYFYTVNQHVEAEVVFNSIDRNPRRGFQSRQNVAEFCERVTMATHDKTDGQASSRHHHHHSDHKFDLQIVHDAFESCIDSDGNISLDLYLQAYKELLRFINLLGKLFHFVSSDVQEKITIMDEHRDSAAGCNYQNVSGMLEYEVNKDITIVKRHPPSGARTLLRLHRALLFLSEFMKHLAEMGPHDKVPAVLYKVYEDTLASYHSWFVRKAFGVAVYAVPTRQHLLEKLCKRDCSDDEMLSLLKQVPVVIQPVYDATQKFYEKHKLLDLP